MTTFCFAVECSTRHVAPMATLSELHHNIIIKSKYDVVAIQRQFIFSLQQKYFFTSYVGGYAQYGIDVIYNTSKPQ